MFKDICPLPTTHTCIWRCCLAAGWSDYRRALYPEEKPSEKPSEASYLPLWPGGDRVEDREYRFITNHLSLAWINMR